MSSEPELDPYIYGTGRDYTALAIPLTVLGLLAAAFAIISFLMGC